MKILSIVNNYNHVGECLQQKHCLIVARGCRLSQLFQVQQQWDLFEGGEDHLWLVKSSKVLPPTKSTMRVNLENGGKNE